LVIYASCRVNKYKQDSPLRFSSIDSQKTYVLKQQGKIIIRASDKNHDVKLISEIRVNKHDLNNHF